MTSPRSDAPMVTVMESTHPGGRKPGLADYLFGRRLATDEEEHQQIGPLAGVPVLGLDALSSAAYGPEAALTLAPCRSARSGSRYVVPISGVIIGVLLDRLLLLPADDRRVPERRRIVHRREGEPRRHGPRSSPARRSRSTTSSTSPSGISAGVGALVSAVPALLPHTLAALPRHPRPPHDREPARDARVGRSPSCCRRTCSSRRSAWSSASVASRRSWPAGTPRPSRRRPLVPAPTAGGRASGSSCARSRAAARR